MNGDPEVLTAAGLTAAGLTAEEEREWRERHHEHQHKNGCHRHLEGDGLAESTGPGGWCDTCGENWPCATVRLLATLDVARDSRPVEREGDGG